MSKIAVFFDAENVSAEVVPGIISFLSKQGDVLYQRAYADWSSPNMKKWEKQIPKRPLPPSISFTTNRNKPSIKY